MKEKLSKFLPMVGGVILGAIGAMMIQRTLPPAVGSPEERVVELEHELKKVRAEFKALADTSPRKRFGATTHEGVRSIAQRMREGLPVTPDDLFNAFKPLMRDLSPLTERMRVVESRRHAESLAGEYARKYGLSDDQQKQLIEHLAANHLDQAKAVSNIVESDHTSLKEYMEAEREFDREAGIDAFMAQNLQGETLESFQIERLNEKSESVQRDADLQVKRIDAVVKLDDKQRHQMFLYMAQTSPKYDPQMQFDGVMEGSGNLPANMKRNEAMLSVLNENQRQTYELHREQQLQKARQDAARLGLTVPNDWDPDDDIW